MGHPSYNTFALGRYREEEYISLIDRKNNQIEKLKRNLEDFSETEVKILQKRFPEEKNTISILPGLKVFQIKITPGMK
ncbi:conserved hypothetical protein [Leptospira interrogans serovar Manilae]|uniref:Uncharacterized protein n=1 Tax=Leptospira interrogans serovar Manilae TaxID=214675 RepID=A0AAQ1SMQ8_LEPIR|nr:hypothetical protein [Leptospira interrogans]SOR60638.1 conserved hypothetical protein [Leptospira interrogans serovar Manilae]